QPRGARSFPTRRSSDLESVARAKPALEGWLVRRATGARREVHKVGRHNHARWLLGAVLTLAATLAVPRDGQTQMGGTPAQGAQRDRKSTRLNSSHVSIS